MDSVIPCSKGGHHCSWPACPPTCAGRPGSEEMEEVFVDEDENDCDCIDAEEDILTGRVECFRCGRTWYS